MMLEKMGYQVVTANDGQQALRYFEEAKQDTPFAFAIPDLTVPGGMGGKQTA
jgi:two-component system cell cycle sensor histidine kinase/response regulator CckA